MRNFLFYLVFLFMVSCSATDHKSSEEQKLKNVDTTIVQTVFSVPEVPNKISFAGETIDLTDVDIRERFDRELVVNNFWHSNTILYIKRANRWFPVMKKILRENGVPEDFVYLSVIESGLTQATSAAGARGFWQFMKPTAKQYDLAVNREVDERLNIEKSTQAACTYLKRSYLEFGSWSLAAASYNRGVQGIRNALEEQNVNSYFDLSLNNETSRYVFRILAIKEIMEDPKKFGFDISSDQLYPEYEVERIEVRHKITNLADWANEKGTTLKIIRRLNPWIRRNKLNANEHITYEILLPKNNEQLGAYKG